jgi:hypothetical protein
MSSNPDVIAALRGLERRGLLQPFDVVEAARDPGSPLHDSFEWNDSVAAERYRLEQARRLIRTVWETDTDLQTFNPPIYVHDPDLDPGEQGYARIDRLATEEERARRAVVSEFGRALAMLHRAQTVSEMLGISTRVRRVIRQLEQLIDEVEKVLVEPAE